MVETQRSYVCKEMSAKIKLSKPGIFPQRKLGSPQVDGSSCVFLPALHSCLKHQKKKTNLCFLGPESKTVSRNPIK